VGLVSLLLRIIEFFKIPIQKPQVEKPGENVPPLLYDNTKSAWSLSSKFESGSLLYSSTFSL